MNLQNGYKVIYEVTADGKRAFYATKGNTCDPVVDDKIVESWCYSWIGNDSLRIRAAACSSDDIK